MFHLALSKNKKFWEISKRNLYLGPWEMPEILNKNFSKYELEIPDWPWDDLDKFYRDNLKVWDIYEKFICNLAEILNELHGLNWNLKAWKILIGPWLRRYLSIIYERNETITSLYDLYDLRSCNIKNFSLTNLQIKDFNDFSSSYHNEDFNNTIYTYILKKKDIEKKIQFKEIDFNNKKNSIKNKNSFNIFKQIKKNLIIPVFLNRLTSFFIKKNKYYLQSVYFKNKFQLTKFNLLLGNFPYLRLLNVEVKDEIKFDKSLREKFYEKLKLKIDLNKDKFFEKLIIDLIYYMFPRCYLENFKINKEFSKKIFFSFNPKIIIDSVSYHKDELFKFWLSQKIQKDTKLILLQHGGYYEQCKFKDDFLGHELEISDQYVSWGWNRKKYAVNPLGIPISFKKKKSKKDNTFVNIILRTAGDYFVNFSTNGNPNKNSEVYINDVIKIANSISQNKKLRIFLHPLNNQKNERGFALRPYLQEKITHKDIEFFYGKIEKYINLSDMNIFTYIGTPYNQTISGNIPCLLFHNEMYEPLNEEYRYLYNSMVNNELLYTNIQSLANKINYDDDKFYEWWNKKDTVEIKNLFCKNFAKKIKNINDFKKMIIGDRL